MWIIITIITPHLISSPTSFPFHLSSHNIVHHSSTSSIHVFYGFKCTQGSSLDGEGYDRERNTATLYFPLRCPPPTPWRGWGSTHIVIILWTPPHHFPLTPMYFHPLSSVGRASPASHSVAASQHYTTSLLLLLPLMYWNVYLFPVVFLFLYLFF